MFAASRIRPPSTRTVQLKAGQCFHEWTRAGATIVVSKGRVVLETPAVLLAETVCRSTLRIGTGEPFVTASRGWLCVRAEAEVAFEVIQPVSAIDVMRDVATDAWRRVRRTLVAKSL